MDTILFFPNYESELAHILENELNIVYIDDFSDLKKYSGYLDSVIVDTTLNWDKSLTFLKQLQNTNLKILPYISSDPYKEEVLIKMGMENILKQGYSKDLMLDFIAKSPSCVLDTQDKEHTIDPVANEHNSAEKMRFMEDIMHHKEVLKSFTKLLSSGYTVTSLIDILLGVIEDLLKVSRVSLFLKDDKGFIMKRAYGIPHKLVEKYRMSSASRLIDYLQKEGVVVKLSENKNYDLGFYKLGFRYAVPIFNQGQLIGVIGFNNKVTGDSISQIDLETVYTLGLQFGIAMDNVKLMEVVDRQKSYLEDVFDNITSGIIGMDRDGKIVSFNNSASSILNKDLDKFSNMYIGKVIENFGFYFQKMMKEDSSVLRQEMVLEDCGKYIEVNVVPIRAKKDDITGLIMILNDFTPVKKMEEERVKAKQMEFVGTVARRSSHEFKNCLVSIKTFAQLFPKRYQDPSFREDFYNVVNKEVDRLNNVIENILFFAQPMELQYTLCNIKDIIENTIHDIQMEQQDQSQILHIHTDYIHGKEEIYMDINAIKRTINALMMNSIQVSPEGCNIWIKSSDTQKNGKDFLQISVKDDGPGISPDDLEKIWEPFFTKKAKGIGLGLTIVKRIIETHRGMINLSSKRGEGTEFNLYLPYSYHRAIDKTKSQELFSIQNKY